MGLRPVYVQREDHARGLVRLLSLAVRVLTVVEHVVRAARATAGEELRGLSAGNPTRATARPTTEPASGGLKAFKGVTLTVIEQVGQTITHLTALSPLQRQIVTLLGLPASLYEALPTDLHPNPP